MADEKVTVEVELETNEALEELKRLQNDFKKLLKAVEDAGKKIDEKEGKSIWQRFALTRGIAEFGAKRMQATGRRFQIPTAGGVAGAALSKAGARGDTKAIGQAVYGATSLISRIAPALMRGGRAGGVTAAFMAGPAGIEAYGVQTMAFMEGVLGTVLQRNAVWRGLTNWVSSVAAELSNLGSEIKAPVKAGADVTGIARAALRLGGERSALDINMRRGEFRVLREFHAENSKYLRAIEVQKEAQYAHLYGRVMNQIGRQMAQW